MKRLKYVLIFGILLFIPNIVKADSCSVTNTSRLKKIASNITTKYDYTETFPQTGYGSVSFTVTISNVISDVYVMKVDDYFNKKGSIYYGDGNNQIVISNLSEGTSYHFLVYGNTNDSCRGTLVYEFYVNTPDYNAFYTNYLCDNISTYKYCKKWANINMTETEFTSNVKEYIKSLNSNDTDDEEEDDNTDYENLVKVLEFLAKYDILIFGSVIVLSMAGIIAYRKKDNFDLKIK